MKNRSLDTSRLLLSAFALALVACNDDRMRELGYTVSQPLEGSEASAEPAPPCALDFISADAVQREAAADLAALASNDRPFTRYLSLANRVNAGACPDEIERDRDAASKLLNGLSREPDVVVPVAVGSVESLLRIDLRAYGWTRPVAVSGTSHRDHWEALIEQTPQAIELGGADGTFVAAQTGTRAPILSVDAFLVEAASAPLYYALLGVPDTLGALRASVGLPSELDPPAAGAIRRATTASRVVQNMGDLRAVDRYETRVGSGGTYFEGFRVGTVEFLSDPLHVQPAVEREVIFSLPNGLLGFAVTDAAGELSSDASFPDTNHIDFRARVFDSCGNCHAFGLIPIRDNVGPLILGRPDLFSEEVVAAYRAAPSDDESIAQLAADSEPYQQAVERATGSPVSSDPISARMAGLTQELSLATAAADLLVPTEQLEAAAGELVPFALGLTLSHAQFSSAYAAVFCSLHAADDNPPDAAFCARVR
jgi:hypothetical protein